MGYCSKYDAEYNEDGSWKEGQCCDEGCRFCIRRPEKHINCLTCRYEGVKDSIALADQYVDIGNIREAKKNLLAAIARIDTFLSAYPEEFG